MNVETIAAAVTVIILYIVSALCFYSIMSFIYDIFKEVLNENKDVK